jgi:hypothetical protein
MEPQLRRFLRAKIRIMKGEPKFTRGANKFDSFALPLPSGINRLGPLGGKLSRSQRGSPVTLTPRIKAYNHDEFIFHVLGLDLGPLPGI